VLNLKIHTEYSFRYAFGKIKDIISSQETVGSITDKHTTFGHIPFWKECKKQGKKCILGVELSFVDDAKLKVRQNHSEVVFLARNEEGLAKIYEIVSKATKQRYYYPRLSYEELLHIPEDNIVIIFSDFKTTNYLKNRKNTFLGVSPLTNYQTIRECSDFEFVAISENIYDKPENEKVYQAILAGSKYENRVELSHILNEFEWTQEIRLLDNDQKRIAIENTYKINDLISDIEFPQAKLPIIYTDKSLMELCENGARKLKIDLNNEIYRSRLNKEIEVIEQKEFTEYFLIVKDLVDFANCRMLLGPARGSSAGSLVCFLLGITTIDPIKFDLIFERFIDVNRADLPDIDIDFQDTKRDMCLDYLRDKYGNEKVAKLGTISKYKPDSILLEFNKILDIPNRLLEDFKTSMIVYGPGDSRFGNSILDTLMQTEAGKNILEDVPNIIYSSKVEGHNRHYGQHAAGIIIADKELYNYCALDLSSNSCMLDKKDAEIVNLLKIDCLGLRTLTVINDCLDLIKKDKEWLINFPLDCEEAFDVLNKGNFFGIFQFEGNALKNICKRIKVKNFNDISHLTALARPGPLRGGGTERYLDEREPIVKYHDSCKDILQETRGVIVYQEQIMKIAREVGHMTWERVSALRKAVSKSFGIEAIEAFYPEFEKGAMEQTGLTKFECKMIWIDIVQSGEYAFNKAHSVSYAMVSYWCLILKAFYPMEFALVTLQNSKGENQTFNVLVELLNEGYNFELFNRNFSEIEWCIKNNTIYGGYTNIKGVGRIKAKVLIDKRKKGSELTACENRDLFESRTPYDAIINFANKIKDYHENWSDSFFSKPIYIKNIESSEEEERISIFICDSEIKKNAKGRKFLKFTGCDNTGLLTCLLCGNSYDDYKNIIREKDSLYLILGRYQSSFGMFIVKNIKKVLTL